MQNDKIKLEWNADVKEIIADPEGRASAVLVHNSKTDQQKKISCKGVFIAIGHIPNTKPFEEILPIL